jgi:hypothetical protein
MLRRTSTIVASIAVAGMFALQGCSSPSGTQASSGGQPTNPASPAAAGGGSPTASDGSPTAPASSASSSANSSSPATNPGSTPKSSSPSTSAPGSGSSTSGTFTVPAASSAVDGWGSYQVINAHRIHVEVCAKKVGNVFAIGVEAIAYNSDYSQSGEIASVILPQTPGQQGCSQTYLLYTAHLKVYSFIGQGGTITKKTPLKSIF